MIVITPWPCLTTHPPAWLPVPPGQWWKDAPEQKDKLEEGFSSSFILFFLFFLFSSFFLWAVLHEEGDFCTGTRTNIESDQEKNEKLAQGNKCGLRTSLSPHPLIFIRISFLAWGVCVWLSIRVCLFTDRCTEKRKNTHTGPDGWNSLVFHCLISVGANKICQVIRLVGSEFFTLMFKRNFLLHLGSKALGNPYYPFTPHVTLNET